MQITIFGHGNLGSAVGQNFVASGNQVNYITHQSGEPVGDLVVLAVPFTAIDDIVSRYQDQLAGKIVVDATNPINFQNWTMAVPADSSSAAQTAKKLPQSKVLKAFNTSTAVSMANGKLANGQAPQVLVAGDDDDAKQTFEKSLADSPLTVIDVGTLARAHDLESLGMIELSMAAGKKLPMDGGFLIVK